MTGAIQLIRLPYPHLGQRTIRRQAKRFNYLAAGRRWRKTTLGVAIAVESAVHGLRILWGAPTYDQVRIAWNETKHGAGGVAKFTQQTMTGEFPSGGTIVYRSLDDPDNARGHTADGVIIDEVEEVKAEAWYEVLRPMLLDTGGWMWGMGTPKGRNWFWREHQNAPDRSDTMAWQVPTLGCVIGDRELVRKPHPLENSEIRFEEIRDIWRTVPERTFKQEILAEFLEDAGGVFRRVAGAATAQPLEQAIAGHGYVFGVDWGKYEDFTAISVLDTTTKTQAHLDRFNQIDYTLQVGRLKVLYERFRPYTIIAEANAMGEPLIEQLVRQGMPVTPFRTTNATKAAAIDALALAFERGDITILDDATQTAELQAYEMRRLPSGLMRYSAPGGMHDDTVIALALAWQGVAVGPPAGIIADVDVSQLRRERRSVLWRK